MKPRFLKELKFLREEVEHLRQENESLRSSVKQQMTAIRAAFSQTPRIAVQGYNADREITYWNHYSTELYGYTEEEALGRKLEELIIPLHMRDQVIELVQNWIEHDIAIDPDEHWLLHKDGSFVPVYSQHFLLRSEQEPLEMYCIDIDLRDLRKAEQMLAQAREFAVTDIMTGLKNRHYYRHHIREYLDQASQTGKRIVFSVIDIDNFKSYNALYGQQSGDGVIRGVAETIQSCLTRSNDLVVRIGGEEFIACYTVEADANYLGPIRNILKGFEERGFEHIRNEPEQIVTLSAGVVTALPGEIPDSERLLSQAYAVLDTARENGHNSVMEQPYIS